MATKKTAAEKKVDWSTVEVDTEIKVKNERGRFVFKKVHDNGDVTVFGGSNGKAMFRSFTPDRCRPIYRRKKPDPKM